MKYTYIVSWTITIMAYVPCKSVDLIAPQVVGMADYICSETDEKHFSIGFLNRDSALLVYKRCISNDIRTVKLDSIGYK